MKITYSIKSLFTLLITVITVIMTFSGATCYRNTPYAIIGNESSETNTYSIILSQNSSTSQPIGWTAKANDTEFTTAIIFEFNAPISDLTINHIRFNPAQTLEAGLLTGDGTTWSLEINVRRAGTLYIRIDKRGIERQLERVEIFRPMISWSARANNTTLTTAIHFEFSEPVSGLSADDIRFSAVDGSYIWAFVEKGALTGSGKSWTLEVRILRSGVSLVFIDKTGIEEWGEVDLDNIGLLEVFRPPIKWKVTAVGDPQTTHLNFILDTPVSVDSLDINITDGTGSAEINRNIIGFFSGAGTTWSLAITVIEPGTVYVLLNGS